MLPSHHAAGAALAILPLRKRGWSPLAIAQFAAAAVLIDADHYASYVWRIRDLSLPQAYRFHRRRAHHPFRLHRPALVVDTHRPLHAPLLLAGLTLLARRYPVLWPLVGGMLFHRLLDYAASVAGVFGALRDHESLRAPGHAERTRAGAQDGTAYSKTLK
jgi:hypothetical protein